MILKLTKSIPYLFYALFFLIPLVLFHKTSELFEFNKIIILYGFTAIITCIWFIKIVVNRQIIFKRTFIDIPLVVFLLTQTLSALVSVDTRTSLLGYYSRFNGGLLSSWSYALLYWAYAANMDREKTLKLIKVTFISTVISSVWAILEHFGRSFSCLIFPGFRTFDVSCWVQDVAFRVYSTFGQPNWLAAYLVAIIPITWALVFYLKTEDRKKPLKIPGIEIVLFSVFFLTLLYTKSRSGLLGYVTADVLFWVASFIYFFVRYKESLINYFKALIIFHIIALVFVSVTGTSWTPSLSEIIKNQQKKEVVVNAPALEVGGTASSKIRTIVWRGAFDIWKNYPVLGTGVETFAFTYYAFRPAEHNLVSEWDYLYNKAHNEYLNMAATTGTLGLIGYLILIAGCIWQIATVYKRYPKDEEGSVKHLAFLSGFSSILVTNFFGFSVVPVSLLFFLYPALAESMAQEDEITHIKDKNLQITTGHKILIAILALSLFFSLYALGKYWYADVLYASGKNHNDAGNYINSREYLLKAVSLSPNEAVFWEELGQATTNIAVALSEQGSKSQAEEFKNLALQEVRQSVYLSGANVNIKRSASNAYIKLSLVDPSLIVSARDILNQAVKQAPTDAKLYYNLGLAYIRTGETQKALQTLGKTTQLKPDYRNAFYALGLVYIDAGQKDEAKEQFEYILNKLNPEDADAKRELDELGI